MSKVPSTGPHVEVENPTTGHTFTPDVITITPQPQTNGRPSIRIAVPRSDKWLTLLEDHPNQQIPLRVWRDGDRDPIDTFDDVEQSPEQTVLIGSGGRELRRQASREIDQQPVPEVVRDLVGTETSYARTVDDPPLSQSTVDLATLSSESDWLSRTDRQPTDPWYISSNGPTLYQTCFTREAEFYGNSSGNVQVETGGDLSNDTQILLSATGEFVEFVFNLEYRIPEGQFGCGLRFDGGAPNTIIELSIDGNSLGQHGLGTDYIQTNMDVVGEQYLELDEPLEPGEHTVRLEVVSTDGFDTGIDIISPLDKRYSYNFPDTNDGNGGPLGGPEHYPDRVDIPIEQIPAAEAVTAGSAFADFSTTATSPDAVQAVALSNDQGDTYPVADQSTETVSGEFSNPDYGPGITFRATLSRHGSRDTVAPGQGTASHTLQSLDLDATVEDMPLVVNKSLSGEIASILTQLATLSDSLWEVQQDGPRQSVEWTESGQRQSDSDPQLSTYDHTTRTSSIVNKAVVFGRSQDRSGEQFAASHGSAVELRFGEIHEQSERVYDPRAGVEFTAGQDYAIDYLNGTITTKADGRMSDGSQYRIDYQYQARGEFANGKETAETTIERELPALTTEMTCQQAARIIVEQLETPLEEAQATAPPREVGFALIEQINPSLLPGDGIKVREVEPTPSDVALRLGSRDSISDVVGSLRESLTTVSRRV
jgi:hypothetical protein